MKFHFCQNDRHEIHTRIKFQTHMRIKRNIQRVCAYSFRFGQIMFTWKSHAGLKFHFCQNERYEIHTVLSFISPQFKWTQVKSWLNTEVRFWTEMKSHTGLRSFRPSCARTLARTGNNKIKLFTRKMYQSPCQEEYSAYATYRSCSVIYTCDSMRIRGLGRVILEFTSVHVH